MRYPRGDYCLFDQYVPLTTPNELHSIHHPLHLLLKYGWFHQDFWNKLGTGIIKKIYEERGVHSITAVMKLTWIVIAQTLFIILNLKILYGDNV